MVELAASPERNVVTIAVIDTVGSTEHIAMLDPDDAQALLDGIFHHIRETIERAGGLLVSFAGDGGVAVFGWPGSQEDHADRACEAAWEVQHPVVTKDPLLGPDGEPIRFRIGIHSGLVGLRRLNLEGSQILDLVGATIHLAAALEKRAPPGEILLSSKALQLCRAEMQLHDHDGFPALTKIDATVHRLCARPHRLTASDMVQRHRLPMIGREDERALMQKCMPVRDADNHTIAIIGEPGIGKSRLVTAAIRDAHKQPISINTLVFPCELRRRAKPFVAMKSLLAQALEIDERASLEEFERALTENQSVDDQDVTAKLVSFWDSGLPGGNAAENATELVQTLVDGFATYAIRQPVLIVVEDMHWLDPESLRCFAALKSRETSYPFTLFLTGRPEAEVEANEVADKVVHLAPLSTDHMLELAEHVGFQGKADQSVLNQVVKRADGIPFVLEQLLSSLDANDPKAQIKLPQSVESVIHARLNQLTPATKTLAQALSVFGEDVELQFASRTMGIAAENLQKSLAELEKQEIIHPPLGRKIQFRHAIILDACATTVGREARKLLHLQALETIKELHPNLDDQYESMAFHAESADDDVLALDYLWKAGLIANRSWASGSLLLIFERAVACMDRIGTDADEQFVNFVLMTYAPLLQLGEFTRMNPHLVKALEIAKRLGRDDKLCGMLCQVAMICWFDGRYEEGLKAALEAVDMAKKLDSITLLISSQIMLGNMYWGMAKIDNAIKAQKELADKLIGNFRTAKLGAAAIPSSFTRANISWYMMEIGQYEEGLPYATEALEIALDQRDVYTEVLARIVYGRNMQMLGRNEEAEDCLRLAHKLAMRHGYDPAARHIVGLLSATLARNDKAEEALIILEHLENSKAGSRAGELENYYFHAGHAEALFRLERFEACLNKIDRAIDHAMSINNQCLITQGLGLRAFFRLQIDPDDADGLRDKKMQENLCKEYGLTAWI